MVLNNNIYKSSNSVLRFMYYGCGNSSVLALHEHIFNFQCYTYIRKKFKTKFL